MTQGAFRLTHRPPPVGCCCRSHAFDRRRAPHIGSCRKNDGPTGRFSPPPVCPRTRREPWQSQVLVAISCNSAAARRQHSAFQWQPVHSARRRRQPRGNGSTAEDIFYRDDWFGEPWRKPETVILIHGNGESSIVWYAWLPRMGQEFRVLRLDLPGFGR